MTLIPKPSKPPTKPETLRPLNLMSAEAKVIGITIRERLQPYAETYMQRIPQFAFLQGRNSLHCILRVHQHCREVRQRLAEYTSNLHNLRHSGKPSTACFGNPSKSDAILEVRGTALRKAMKQSLTKQASRTCLRIPPFQRSNLPVLVPLQPQTKYLGVIISYRNFEDATIKRNISRARLRFRQMRQVLTSRSTLGPGRRVILWRACLESIYLRHTSC